MSAALPVLDRLDRVRLVHGPTPLEAMPRLSDRLGGPRIYVKRDDATGFAAGGNKGRKLEYLIGAALKAGADTVITAGALQTNHGRQTAAAAAKLGLKCVLVLTDAVTDRSPAYHASGNLLLDRLTGAEIRRVPASTNVDEEMARIADEKKRAGRIPYVIPVGGSSPVGALGYAVAGEEIAEQSRALGLRPAAVVHATGSCGTQVGLLLGLAATGIPVTGVCVSRPKDDQEARVKALLSRTVGELQLDAKLAMLAVEADDRFIGPGYGQPTPGMIEAVRLAAECEGLFLDPVYTGKGLAGLIQRIREGRYRKDDSVVFVHTGGLPGLFVYDEAFP
ncbi:MAG: D-cysteine desulfhydrase [Alphaproteobacteria bacterium]|nr:D-cysteine desulfhydrase [Alphaproteobacteria bacterium]